MAPARWPRTSAVSQNICLALVRSTPGTELTQVTCFIWDLQVSSFPCLLLWAPDQLSHWFWSSVASAPLAEEFQGSKHFWGAGWGENCPTCQQWPSGCRNNLCFQIVLSSPWSLDVHQMAPYLPVWWEQQALSHDRNQHLVLCGFMTLSAAWQGWAVSLLVHGYLLVGLLKINKSHKSIPSRGRKLLAWVYAAESKVDILFYIWNDRLTVRARHL